MVTRAWRCSHDDALVSFDFDTIKENETLLRKDVMSRI